MIKGRWWAVISDTRNPLDPEQLAGSDPTTNWQDAVDRYTEHRGWGWETRVFLLDFETATICDHTAEAHDHLRDRLEACRQELPEWMEDAV